MLFSLLRSAFNRLRHFYFPSIEEVEFDPHSQLPRRPRYLRLLATALLLYNLDAVVDYCTAATNDLLRERIGHPQDFSHRPPALAELLRQMDQQLWLLRNTGGPSHWGPSR